MYILYYTDIDGNIQNHIFPSPKDSEEDLKKLVTWHNEYCDHLLSQEELDEENKSLCGFWINTWNTITFRMGKASRDIEANGEKISETMKKIAEARERLNAWERDAVVAALDACERLVSNPKTLYCPDFIYMLSYIQFNALYPDYITYEKTIDKLRERMDYSFDLLEPDDIADDLANLPPAYSQLLTTWQDKYRKEHDRLAVKHITGDTLKVKPDFCMVIKPAEGTFLKGDTIHITGCYSNKSTKTSTIVFYYGTQKLFGTEQFANTYDGETVPTEQLLVLEQDCDSICLGREGNTSTCVTALTVVRPASATIKGDVNNDGSVTMADANMVVNYFLAEDKNSISGFNKEAGDVNKDGDISMADANAIVNIFLGTGE